VFSVAKLLFVRVFKLRRSNTNMSTETEPKKHKKRRFKRHYWLLVDLAVVIIVFALLLYKPARYEPLNASLFDLKLGQVHPYWTQLSSEIYNGAQLQEPFEVVIIEEKINEAIAGWSEASEGIVLSAPAALFVPDRIVLMGLADMKGLKLVVTVEIEPEIDESRLLHLQVEKVKVGAMNITPAARFIAKRKYDQQAAIIPVDTEDWRAQIAGSLLNDKPFEPIFRVEDKKVRLEKITIQKKKLILRLTPVP